ncbi:hypothetical protein C9374_012286 [Naegleria lovaniensis]|uniref:Uncharacterized protein n=1 Tax=Naegleria lovaniensis TaxID=51637 RepID=A0AA88KHX3_NAELO|nr:uncharacterized protein C9374_012286 [Naegleria lovaniensis]KAG2373297.1 hypothetical protein C9374_012286 [Naegleria lovaniensis]
MPQLQATTPFQPRRRLDPFIYTEIPISDRKFSNSTFYVTHDNGGCPFLVEIIGPNSEQVNIYESAYAKTSIASSAATTSSCLIRQEMTLVENGPMIVRQGLYHLCPGDSRPSWYALIKEIKQSETPFEVFIGYDNYAILSGLSENPDATHHGASVLIRFKATQECWHVGICVMKFVMDEKIEKLYSTVGNSDVVYPYIVTNSNIYVIESKVYYKSKDQLTNADPFDDFYSNQSEWTRVEEGFSETTRVTSKDIDNPATELTSL